MKKTLLCMLTALVMVACTANKEKKENDYRKKKFYPKNSRLGGLRKLGLAEWKFSELWTS